MVIHNQIFDTFRAEQKEIDKAIKLLEKNGFIVYNKEKKYIEQ
jgi:transcription initiation factor IIE alpha subunit|tara:strand:- start:1900 stop:2028 length:129 start_codon:yes stop_codon:yes gene_type:complete